MRAVSMMHWCCFSPIFYSEGLIVMSEGQAGILMAKWCDSDCFVGPRWLPWCGLPVTEGSIGLSMFMSLAVSRETKQVCWRQVGSEFNDWDPRKSQRISGMMVMILLVCLCGSRGQGLYSMGFLCLVGEVSRKEYFYVKLSNVPVLWLDRKINLMVSWTLMA